MGTWQVSKRGIKGKGKEGKIGKKMGKRASGVLREKRGIGKEDTIWQEKDTSTNNKQKFRPNTNQDKKTKGSSKISRK